MPALEFKNIQLSFGQGLAQEVAPALVKPGKLHTADQATIDKDGSVQQRPGTDALSTDIFTFGGSSTTLSAARHVIADGRETLVTTPYLTYTYQEADDHWQLQDHAYEATLARVIGGERGDRSEAAQVNYVDAIYSNGWIVTAWNDVKAGKYRVRFVDHETGARNLECSWDWQTSANYQIRLVACGNYVYAFWHDLANNQIRAAKWDATDVEAGFTQVVVGNTADSSGFFDANSTTTNVYLAYLYNPGASPATCVVRGNADLSSTNNAIVAGAVSSAEYGIAQGPVSTIYVAFTTTTTIEMFALADDTGLAVSVAVQTVRSASKSIRLGVCATHAGACIVWEQRYLSGYNAYRSLNAVWTDDSGSLEDGHQTPHLGLTSRPIEWNNSVYCVADLYESRSSTYTPFGSSESVSFTVVQRNAYLVHLRKGTAIPGETVEYQDAQARCVVRMSTHTFGDPGVNGGPCNLSATAGNRYVVALPVQSETISGRTEGFDLFEVEFDGLEQHIPTIAQTQTVLSGGVPAMYDGRHLSEYGFHWYPFSADGPGPYSESTGGLLTAGATYQWCFVYEWRDARGNRHQSAPSIVYEYTLTSTNTQITHLVANLCMTEHADAESNGWPVKIVVYRTAADANGNPGGIFYREGEEDSDVETALTGIVVGGYFADTDLVTKEILYVDGGVLPNFQPPSLRHIVQHDRRLWGISNDDPTLIWISKLMDNGSEMPGFSTLLVTRSELGGANVALASLGSSLLALKEEGVFIYSGSPPNDLGEGGNLGNPTPIANHTGCINPKSVVVCPAGVAFQSRDSIWLVDRGMQCRRVGAAVEDTIASYPYCRGATLDQRRGVVYFAMTDGENRYADNPTAGVTLVWHYLVGDKGEWTIWHFPKSDSTDNEPARGAAMCWRSDLARYDYHQTQGDGTIVYLDNGYHDHDGTDPDFTVSTPWLSFAGLAGFQRVQRIHFRGTYVGPHTLDIAIYYDFETSAGDNILLTEAEVEALRDGTEEHLRIHVPRQKCKAIRVAVQSASGASPVSGGHVRWESLAAKVGVKKGLFKLPAAGSR